MSTISGRRKEATAVVKLTKGTGMVTVNKKNIDDVALSISKFFCLNLYIMMPWDPSILCTHIDYQNIKQLSSASKPWMFPLIVKNNTNNKNEQSSILEPINKPVPPKINPINPIDSQKISLNMLLA